MSPMQEAGSRGRLDGPGRSALASKQFYKLEIDRIH